MFERLSANPHCLELPRWLWLWLPLFMYLGHYLAYAVLSPHSYDYWFPSETGLTEHFTIVFALGGAMIGAVVAAGCLRERRRSLAAWFGLLTLGCVYFAGEEASWGQHLIGWETPQSWDALNDQGETNLHNLGGPFGSLLDQLPRNLLLFGALIGGALMPLWRRWYGRLLDPASRAYWFFPTFVCVPVGLIAALSTVPEKVQEAVWGEGQAPIDIQAGEVKELMLAFFLMLYLLSVWQRRRQAKPARV